jgi:hypothetical protein
MSVFATVEATTKGVSVSEAMVWNAGVSVCGALEVRTERRVNIPAFSHDDVVGE